MHHVVHGASVQASRDRSRVIAIAAGPTASSRRRPHPLLQSRATVAFGWYRLDPVTCLAGAMPRPPRLCRTWMPAVLDAMDAMPLSAVRDLSAAASRARKQRCRRGKGGGEGLATETLPTPPPPPLGPPCRGTPDSLNTATTRARAFTPDPGTRQTASRSNETLLTRPLAFVRAALLRLPTQQHPGPRMLVSPLPAWGIWPPSMVWLWHVYFGSGCQRREGVAQDWADLSESVTGRPARRPQKLGDPCPAVIGQQLRQRTIAYQRVVSHAPSVNGCLSARPGIPMDTWLRPSAGGTANGSMEAQHGPAEAAFFLPVATPVSSLAFS